MTSSFRHDILTAGPGALDELPTPDRFAARPDGERHLWLDDRRDELYRVASVVADGTLRRAWEKRVLFPPYGLARSMFSQLRVVAIDPQPFEAGTITGFEDLGRAVIDTVVYHLQQELTALRRSEQAWLVERLDQLLALYRIEVDRAAQARMRDSFSFLYGGLHFGASVCVQMVEAMNRFLASQGISADQKSAVMRGSVRVLYQLAAVNLDEIPTLYQHLLGGPTSPWFSIDRLALRSHDGRPASVEVVWPALGAADRHRYRTRGCPARSAPTGGPGAIATLWEWCIQLGLVTGSISGG